MLQGLKRVKRAAKSHHADASVCAPQQCVLKEVESHMHMVALSTVWYNDVGQYKSRERLSPAMAAGLSETLWSVTDMAEMIDTAVPKPGPRSPYKKQRAA